MPKAFSILRCAALAVLCFGVACSEGGTDPAPVPASLAAVSATTQAAVVGVPVSAPPTVRVMDSRGRPMAGVPVAFAVTGGDGSVAAPSVQTDAQGHASVAWTMGTAARENLVSATAAGLAPVEFRARAAAAQPVTLEKLGGDGQTGAVGTVLRDSFAVRVLDSFGNGVPGVTVHFVSGAGTPSHNDAATDSLGHVRMALTLGTRPIRDSVYASVMGLGSVRFAVTVTTGPPTRLRKLEGDSQTVSAGRPTWIGPQVEVTDFYGNVVHGAVVTFTPTPGSGVAAPAATSDNLGRARAEYWILGREGVNQLEASSGAAKTTFSANGSGACRPDAHTLFGTVEAQFGTTCFVETRNSHVYTVTFPSTQSVDFSFVSQGLGFPALGFMDQVGRVQLWADLPHRDSIHLRVYAPAGAYQLAGGTHDFFRTGTYRLRSAPYTGAHDCAVPLVIPGVTVPGEARATSCDYPNQYNVPIQSGETIRLTLSSNAFNPRFTVDTRGGGDFTEAIGNGVGTSVQITRRGLPGDRQLEVVVRPPNGATGAYTLKVERL